MSPMVGVGSLGGGGGSTSIGDVITGGTEGSVLFIGPGGILAQDNTNFFWDDFNDFLGIGTNVPYGHLNIVNTQDAPSVNLQAFLGQASDIITLASSAGIPLITFVRADNAGGGDIGNIHMIAPVGKNSGAIHLWMAGVVGAGKFAQQYFNSDLDTYFTQIVNGSGSKIIFRNFSAAGTPTFSLVPSVADGRGRFGINTSSPTGTLDIVGAGGVTKFLVDVNGNVSMEGTVLDAESAGILVSTISVMSGGVERLSLGSLGFDARLDFGGHLLFRQIAGPGIATLTSAGKLRLGDSTLPAHRLELIAGTTTVAPLMFAAGTNLTVPEAGAVEFDGSRLYVTNSTPTRKTIAYTDDTLPAVPSFARIFLTMGA